MRVIGITKYIGLKGTIDIFNKNRDELEKRFNPVFINGILGLEEMSKADDGKAVIALHNSARIYECGEGGILKTLWDISMEEKSGLEADLREIPVKQETVEVCEALDADPYRLDSGGCAVFTAEAECVSGLIRDLREAGMPVSFIGILTDSNDKILINKGAVRYLDRM